MTNAHRPTRTAIRERLSSAWVTRPFSLTFAVVMIPTGMLALILGDSVSRALSNIAVEVVSRFMGALLLAGGVLALIGILRGCTTIEAVGLCLLSAGAGLYGFGVVLGLGLAGMVAGPGYLAISIALLRRVQILLSLASASVFDRP